MEYILLTVPLGKVMSSMTGFVGLASTVVVGLETCVPLYCPLATAITVSVAPTSASCTV